MDFNPSPLDRLLRLEAKIENLMLKNTDPEINSPIQCAIPARHIWPADELLLMRLLRRSPIAITAYQCSAEITTRQDNTLILEPSEQKSPFQFCELADGDAVLWIKENAPEWAYKTSASKQVFNTLTNGATSQPLLIQRLPLFKPIIRGERWTLVKKGELATKDTPFPEESDHINLIIRIENLERQLLRLSSQHETSIRELRTQTQIHQDQINRLLSLDKKRLQS